MKRIVLLLAMFSLLTGCAHVISEDVRAKVDPSVSVSRLFADPDAYRGRTVILGGVIVSARNAKEGTYLEVLEKPLDYRGRPEETDLSQGRFLALHEGFLDTSIFAQGRLVTVAGDVAGWQAGTIGEMAYRYPLVRSREVHIVERAQGGRIPVFFEIGIFKSF